MGEKAEFSRHGCPRNIWKWHKTDYQLASAELQRQEQETESPVSAGPRKSIAASYPATVRGKKNAARLHPGSSGKAAEFSKHLHGDE